MAAAKKKAPLTSAERQRIYRARERKAKADELRELVALAFEYGQKRPTAPAIPPTRLLAQLREARAIRQRAKTSTRAQKMMEALYGPAPEPTTPADTKEQQQ